MRSKLLAVAWWEYSEKIRSKAFLVSLILLPLVIVGLVIVPALFIAGADDEPRPLGIVDETGDFAGEFVRLASERVLLPDGRPNILFRILEPPPGTDIFLRIRSADSLVLAGELEGYYILRSPTGGVVDAEYRTANAGNVRLQERLAPVLREAVTAVRLRERGIDPGLVADLGRSVSVRVFRVSTGGLTQETPFERIFFSVYLYMMMLFFLVMTSGQLLVRSMLEEKSNRIVEVLLSSVPARDLMGGKILGLGGLGLTQLAVWGLCAGVAARTAGLPMIPGGSALLLGAFFLLGYLFYTAVFVSAGAPLATEQEAQQVTSILSLGMVVPLALSFPVLQDPGSTLSVVLTMIPLFTPMMMAIRIPSQMPPAWELLAALGILGVSVIATMRLAGRIFSASVLLSGRRLRLRELRSVISSSG